MKSPEVAENSREATILFDWEDILYALARPIIIGAILGFALAIVLRVANCPTVQLPIPAGESHVASLEAAP